MNRIGNILIVVAALAAWCIPRACGQSITVIPTPRPTEVTAQRWQVVHLTLAVDGTDSQSLAHDSSVTIIREASGPGQMNLAVSSNRLGRHMITITVAKDGRLANKQFALTTTLFR